ncbi:MAG: hypothetical protein GDA50_07975 [Alphaproteobacteria bacterium GM202ARS2]|nr:hypothetical protein [Alphaproteobacteria bacterium GM202ARS2]
MMEALAAGDSNARKSIFEKHPFVLVPNGIPVDEHVVPLFTDIYVNDGDEEVAQLAKLQSRP